MDLNGFVSFDRKIKDWGWYTDLCTFKLFFHMVLMANYKSSHFLGIEIKRGQLARSYATLEAETGLSVQQIRTALKHLLLTGELTQEQHPKFSVFTVVKYSQYQEPNRQLTAEQQASNRQPTGEQQQINKNNKNNKENNNIYNVFFDSVWELYPNKKGKASVKQAQRKKLHAVGFEKLAQAIENYKADKEDWKAWQNGSTFFNTTYQDYLPIDEVLEHVEERDKYDFDEY